jgi:hypothetical protein
MADQGLQPAAASREPGGFRFFIPFKRIAMMYLRGETTALDAGNQIIGKTGRSKFEWPQAGSRTPAKGGATC